MEKSYLYIRRHPSYDQHNACKMGITNDIPERDSTYVTGEIERGFFDPVIEVPKERSSIIEKMLQKYFTNRGFHIYKNGGTEFFKQNIIPLIVPYLEKTNIPFRVLSNTQIDELIRKYRERKINKGKLKELLHIWRLKRCKKLAKTTWSERVKQLQNKRRKDSHKEPLLFHLPILEKMMNHFESNEKGHIIEPCGTGKSFLSIHYTKTVGYKTIVIGTPSVYLQSQMRDEILEVVSESTILFVGGDEDTSIDTIKEKIQNVREGPLFIITTYASCSKLVGLHFDMKIGDECHHLTGIEDNNDGYLRFHDISSNKSLFMTATKKIVDTTNDNTVFSMDDEDIFGKCIDEKSVKWAIDNKVITDYKVVVLKAIGNNIDDIIGELDIQLDDKNVEIFVSAYMTLKSMASYDGLTHVLCYTNTTTHAEQMQRFIGILLDKGIFPSLDKEEFYNEALHSGSNGSLSDEVDIMKNKKHGIISCVYIFGEGFNLPKLNGVCFVENMVSIIRIIQCALRSARIERGNSNKISYLLVPFIDHDDFNEENASHKKVRSIVSNLGNVDENIDERLFVNTLTRREPQTDLDNDNKPAEEQVEDEAYDFRNDDLELRRLRLRLRRSKDLKSKLSMEEEEYIFHKELMKEHNIKSKREYDDFEHDDKKDDIEKYFKQKGVWPDDGWYGLLSIDTSMYPSSKDEWKRVCKDKNIKSMAEYKRYCEQPDSDLPSEPDKLYHKEWTSSIEVELGISKPRRR